MKKLLHWIACHTVILMLTLFLLTAIYFRGPLFGIWPEPEKTAQQEDPSPVAVTSETKPQANADSGTQQSSLLHEDVSSQAIEPQQSADPDRTDGPPEQTEMPDPLASVDEQQQTTPPQPDHDLPQPAPAEPGLSNQAATASATQTETEAMDAEHSARLPDQAEPPTETGQNLSDAAEMMTQQEHYQFRPKQLEPSTTADIQQDLLQQARKAYWNENLQKAKSLYQAFINLDPDNPDGYGELGNLLSTQGNLDEAADMYRKAAALLRQQGKAEQADQLDEVLNSIEVIQNSPE